MDTAAVPRCEGAGSTASDMCWASDDITVLNALLETPAPQDRSQRWTRTGSPRLSQERDHPPIAVGHRGLGEDEDEEDKSREDDADQVVVTSLRRQVHLLQQEYDRQLEQRVAKSVIAAGGRSAPRASTIRLYRQYERLTRVAASLTAENQQLAVLLETQKKLQQEQLPRAYRQDHAGAFQDATTMVIEVLRRKGCLHFKPFKPPGQQATALAMFGVVRSTPSMLPSHPRHPHSASRGNPGSGGSGAATVVWSAAMRQADRVTTDNQLDYHVHSSTFLG